MFRNRRQQALDVRNAAAELAASRPHPRHRANGDEQKFRRGDGKPSYLASFTKGLRHNDDGLISEPDDFQQFIKGLDSGDPRDFIDTPLGPLGYSEKGDQGRGWNPGSKATKFKALVRAWESQGAGNTFDLEGPDARAVTMPPAPALGSSELTAEMAEVYAQALLRDVPFTEIVDGTGKVRFDCADRGRAHTTVELVLDCLNRLQWFKPPKPCFLNDEERGRRRRPLIPQTAFRGITQGDQIGPYISQFLLAGNTGINGNDPERKARDGLITYGAISIDQKVRIAKPCDDHMTRWIDYLDVQQGANLAGRESYEREPGRRFITTPRDLATYVHYDALYEAYLNACLILLALESPFDPGIPFQARDFKDHQQGFAHFGGPHILSLVTEVATRALKAVRYQKFNVHRRLRPEALAARLARHGALQVPEIDQMIDDPALGKLLQLIARKNGSGDPTLGKENYLLPMAFCEGSPMHPSYGAGHATVAGACVTILKAFFDHERPLNIAGGPTTAFVPANQGQNLVPTAVTNGQLTVEGELNKLASNISIGRNWAGVHYFSDYIESLRMGEQIALGILEEQKLTYGENFSMTVPLYDGGSIRI